jgi:glutathione-dependent peroxiredoxin
VFKQKGIDSIVCVSVNDPFVMEEWGVDQEAENVMLLPDGNGAFTEGMGMLVDKSSLNFGKRSWRYSMLVRDKKIEKMFLEPQVDGDPFEVSDADTMLKYLDPNAKTPDQVAILTRKGCSFCAKAKKDLDAAGIGYVEIDLPHTIRSKALGAIAKAQTVPQVFVNGELIGGSEALESFLAKRKA